jgi:penicillin-binding protein 1A
MVGLKRLASLLVGCLALSGVAGCTYTVALDEPDFTAETSEVYDANGDLITSFFVEDREVVKLNEISEYMQKAVVASEDSRFYEHNGVDVRGILRAARANADSGEVGQGGSTITQQYVKVALLQDSSETLERKIKQAVLSLELERRYSKDTILERYLNVIYFGNGAWGAQAAAQHYFGKNASELDLAESALLVGIIPSPNNFDPYNNPKSARDRRSLVLGRMVATGVITKEEAEAAKKQQINLVQEVQQTYIAPHFVEYVRQFILNDSQFGETAEARQDLLFGGGLRIYTTLDPAMQRDAEAAIKKILDKDSYPSAALVAMEPFTGNVRALVGGDNFFNIDDENAKFDLATNGRRQSGSSFKIFALIAALENGDTLNTVYPAPAEVCFKVPGQEDWCPKNYDRSGRGSQSLLAATASSTNTVYARLAYDLGPEKVNKVARDLGIRDSPLGDYYSAVLGTNEVTPLEMATAYSTIAADGVYSPPTFVTRITTEDGTIVYEATPDSRERVIPLDIAREATIAMEGVVQNGTAKKAIIDRPTAGKTGTTNDYGDAWFVGFTPELAASVWVGFENSNTSMAPPATPIRVAGGTWPTEIWAEFMKNALDGVKPSEFLAPPTTIPVDLPEGIVPVVAMPDVSGMPLETALSTLNRNFNVQYQYRYVADMADGTVIGQNPGPGTEIPAGDSVTIIVSSLDPANDGPPPAIVTTTQPPPPAPPPAETPPAAGEDPQPDTQTASVPNLAGMTFSQAIGAIQSAGLDPNAQLQAGAQQDTGRVISQSPAAGQQVDRGATVSFTIGAG